MSHYIVPNPPGSYSLEPEQFATWAIWVALGISLELWAVLTKRHHWTLSYQIWFLITHAPTWADVLGVAAFGAVAALLVLHFWGIRP